MIGKHKTESDEFFNTPGAQPGKQYNKGAYGGYDGTYRPPVLDEQGNLVERGNWDTRGEFSGANEATRRYQGMGAEGVNVDRSEINESRDFAFRSRNEQSDALGLTRDAAQGRAPSQAELLGRSMNEQALAGQMSAAASARGGALAQASAMRRASAAGAAQTQQNNAQMAALRANELATARGQYLQGAGQIRGQDLALRSQDIALATDQARLNEQRQEYFERLGHDVQTAQMNADLGFRVADDTAFNNSQNIRLKSEAQEWNQDKDIFNTIFGSVDSDERMKVKLGSPEKLTKKKTMADVEYRDGIYRELPDDEPAPAYEPMTTEKLHKAIEADIAANPPSYYQPETPKGVAGAPKGYAASRRGQAGYMFGRPGGLLALVTDNGANASQQDEAEGVAPGTTDYRRVMRSDARAKREAFADGINYSQAMQDAAEAGRGMPEAPEYARQKPQKGQKTQGPQIQEVAPTYILADEEPKAGAPARKFVGNTLDYSPGYVHPKAPEVRVIGSRARPDNPFGAGVFYDRDDRMGNLLVAEGPKRGLVMAPSGQPATASRKAEPEPELVPIPVASLPNAPAPTYAAAPPQASQPVAAQYAPMLQTNIRSDERAKTKGAYEPMAAANRSMAAEAYAYKPGMGPSEQKPGEVNVGPMAQNMAADPVARTAIVQEPNGLLGIDKDKGLKLVMGGLASLQGEVDEMKKGRKK